MVMMIVMLGHCVAKYDAKRVQLTGDVTGTRAITAAPWSVLVWRRPLR